MIEIFLYDNRDGLEREPYELLYGWMSEVEKEKINRFKLVKDKQNTLIGRTMIKKIISKKMNVKCSDIDFTANKFGKLYLNNDLPLEFNISHSKDLIACSVGTRQNGIDVEKIKNIDGKSISKHFFQEQEHQRLMEMSDQEREICFFNLWTLKESYIKCIGKGLNISLKSFGFDVISADNIRPRDIPRNYKFKNFEINSYVLSVCGDNEEIRDKISWMSIKNLIER
jgi:4'-phosphopantetheinyl transferase